MGHGNEKEIRTEHDAAGGNNVKAFPDHAADRAGFHVVDEASEEGFAGEVRVVLLKVLLGGAGELHGNKLESLALEAADNLANESALDAVRLDHDVGAFGSHLSFGRRRDAVGKKETGKKTRM